MNLDFNTKQQPFDNFGSFSAGGVTPKAQSGRSPLDPGVSAYDIKRKYPDSPDGFYWIKGHLGQPIPVWCHMNGTGQGFGWMLICAVNGQGSNALGNARSLAIHTRNAVGEIDVSTGTVPAAYKIADADINFWTSNARPQLDHPKLSVNQPVFSTTSFVTLPTDKSTWYGGNREWFIPDTNWTDGQIDFRGKNTGTFSNRGYASYNQYFLNANLNNNSYLSGSYTGWGPTLFESFNQWGNQLVWGATNNGGFYDNSDGGWRTCGLLFYRAG